MAFLASRPSAFRPIQLHRDYQRQVAQLLTSDLTPQNAREALIRAVREIGGGFGATKADLFVRAQSVCPTCTTAQLESSFARGKQRGLFVSLAPVQINWCAETPAIRYTFNQQMDRSRSNSDSVVYLLLLIGGYNSTEFNVWFRSHCNPTAPAFELFPACEL